MNRLLAVLAASILVPFVLAQNIRPVTVRGVAIPARQALQDLFAQMDVRFEIQPDVKGVVSIDAVRADSGETLFGILDQCDAIAEFRNGRYVVRPIRHASVRSGVFQPDRNIELVQYDQADVRLVLKEWLGLYGVRYSASSDVRGCVTLELRNIQAEWALKNILVQVDAVSLQTAAGLQISRRPLVSQDAIPPSP